MKVLKPFQDTTDNFKTYKKGDSYKHDDVDRITFLVKEGYLQDNKKNKADKK